MSPSRSGSFAANAPATSVSASEPDPEVLKPRALRISARQCALLCSPWRRPHHSWGHSNSLERRTTVGIQRFAAIAAQAGGPGGALPSEARAGVPAR
jgi:hypothetical protein